MCGIAGYYNLDASPVHSATLRRMIDVQRHRGPDDQGTLLFSLKGSQLAPCLPGVAPPDGSPAFEGALGFNRLSIVDLSANGHQPMCSEDGEVCIAFNGEVYNAYDYRDELKAAGYRFRSRTERKSFSISIESMVSKAC